MQADTQSARGEPHRQRGGDWPLAARFANPFALLAALLPALLPALALWLAFAFAFAFAAPGAALAQSATEPTSQRARLDAIRADVQAVDTALGVREIGDVELQRLRARVDPQVTDLRTLADELGARAEQAKARLEQLGPKPDPKAAAESAELAGDRAAREKALAEADEAARLARATLVQAEQIISSIADKRRALFARQLFERGPSLLSLGLWGSLLSTLPQDIRALNILVDDWIGILKWRVLDSGALMVLLAFLAAIGLYYARARYLPRIMDRLGASAETTRLKKLLAAAARLAAGALPAAVGSWLIHAALQNTGMVPRRIEPFMWAVLSGVAFVAFVGALADATVAPKWPQRRIFGVADRNARILKKLVTSVAVVLVAAKSVEALLQGIAAGLSLSIVVRGMFALFFAVVVAYWLNKLRDTQAEAEAQDQCLGPYVPVDGALLAPLRLVGWILVVAITGAVLLGFVAFASFLAEQAAWIVIVTSLIALALLLADEGLQTLLTGDGRVAMTLQTNVGLRKRSLVQAAVLMGGVLKLVLIVVGAMLLLAPWGVESADLTSSLRAAFFGFKVGDVTISLSSIVIAAILFGLGLAATKALQRWLDERFLPSTELDTGLRNSLRTMAGYVGFLAALALAVSTLGLSLDRLTIVAGALSVGIGFGLQSIVSNFVSGLILLWERPIRVGDLIVVGDGEGVVKRINVRSTEVETGDRSVVIVPNSNLITGVVKNRVRSDRTGRVLVALQAPRSIDPQRVRALMERAARKHPNVLKEPAPRVFFKKIAETGLDFELFCVVPDVDMVGGVTSDLHFAIYADLAKEGIGQPEREVVVKGLDEIEDTLEELVDAVEEARDGQAGKLARRRRPEPAEAVAEPAPAAAPSPAKPARGRA